MRNALLMPGALAPIHVGRPSSAAAIGAAITATPPALAEPRLTERLRIAGALAGAQLRNPTGQRKAHAMASSRDSTSIR